MVSRVFRNFEYSLCRVPLLQRHTFMFMQNGFDSAPIFGTLARPLEAHAKRELTETAFVVVTAGGCGTEPTF